MKKIAVIGAGITGITSAYALSRRGFDVRVYEQARYPAMETSYANGGQLSASNAEAWNNWPNLIKGVRWMFNPQAPLLIHPLPTWPKLDWMLRFMAGIARYQTSTLTCLEMALAARSLLQSWAEEEQIDYARQDKGILHLYHTAQDLAAAQKVNALLVQGGLERHVVTNEEMHQLEPALQGQYAGGLYTPGDASGDIHQFCVGLTAACERRGVHFYWQHSVKEIQRLSQGFWLEGDSPNAPWADQVDGVVICAGVNSRQMARWLGDRLPIYPVKGYSITLPLEDTLSRQAAPQVSLLDESVKLVCSRLGEDRLRVAGTAEFAGINKDIRTKRIQPLVRWVEKEFPQVCTEHAVPWAGLRPMLPDMVPRVGPGRYSGVYYNTGHGHLGWTLSAATAEMLAAQVDSGQ